MIIPVENKMCSPGLEEREVGSFRNLTQLYIPYMLAKGSSTVRHEEIQWWWEILDQNPSLGDTCSIPCIVHFNRFSL